MKNCLKVTAGRVPGLLPLYIGYAKPDSFIYTIKLL
jgi:hypothetical protein